MTEAIQHHDLSGSVRRFDLPGQGGGVVRLNLWGGAGPFIPQALPADLPPIGNARERVLRLTPRVEGLWASAVSIAITKLAALAWDVETTQPRVGKRAQELLLHADGGAGWVRFLSKHLRAYYCGNAGATLEIARESRAYGSRVVGIHHLPTTRCEPTDDPDIPILYHSHNGQVHELRWWQCIRFVDMPDEDGGQYGICAAERAYTQITKLAAIERYVLEKLTGARPLEVHIVNGVSAQQIDDALTTTKEEQIRVGHTQFMGVVMIPSIIKDAPVGGYRIPIAEVPDGFDYVEVFRHVALWYADALGIDVQDIQPLTGQALGTGAQSVVLDQKARGRGSSIAWRQDFSHQINELVLANPIRFYFNEKDPRDTLAKAQAQAAQMSVISDMVAAGIIDPVQALQMAVDAEIAPKEFLAEDQTAVQAIGDDDKPEVEAEAQMAEQDEETETETKAADLLDAETVAALELVRQVLEG